MQMRFFPFSFSDDDDETLARKLSLLPRDELSRLISAEKRRGGGLHTGWGNWILHGKSKYKCHCKGTSMNSEVTGKVKERDAQCVTFVQRSAKVFVRGCENFVIALAYLFCLALVGSCLARFANF